MMKHRLFCLLTFNLLLFTLYPLHLSAITIAHRYKCDTILWRGRMNELTYMIKVVDAELKKPYELKEIAEMEVLMGQFQESAGNYHSAKRYYQQGADHYRQLDLKKSEQFNALYGYIDCLVRQGDLATTMGEAQWAVTCNNEAVTWMGEWINQVTSHLSEPNVKHYFTYVQIQLQHILGQLDQSVRNFGEGLKGYEEALNLIYFWDNAEQMIEYAMTLMSMADIHERTENYEQAIEHFTRALQIIERTIGPSLIKAQVLTRIAAIYYSLNDLDRAIEYFNQANQLLISLNQTSHPLYAEVCDLAGMIYLNKKELDSSLQAFEVAMNIYKKQVGEESFPYLLATVHSAFPLLYKGQTDAAWDRTGACLHSSLSENFSSDHFVNCANFAFDIGLIRQDYKEIIDLSNDMNELIDESFQGKVSPSVLYRYNINIGRAYAGVDNYTMAANYYDKALQLQRLMAHDVFSFQPERQRELFWLRDESRFESILKLNQVIRGQGTGVARVLYDAALLRKGLMLQASVNLASVVNGSGNKRLAAELQKLRLARMKAEEQGLPLNDEMRQLEQRIMKQARSYGDFMQFTTTTWQQVKQALRPGDVAIEFVASQQGNLTVYSAELLTSKTPEPQHILLFTIEGNKPSPLAGGARAMTEYVGTTVWPERLLKYLTPGCNVYFTPTDQLYNLPIEYLPIGGGKRMNERYRMHRLSSTRLLADRRNSSPSATPSIQQAVLFGGLNYDTSMDEMALYAQASYDRGTHSASLGGLPLSRAVSDFDYQQTSGLRLWGYLPGTLTEVEQIDQLLSQSLYRSRLITGDEGVEESFKTLHNQHTSIIHIATHGFYLPNEKDAMKRSGLVFAGANNFWASGKQPQSDAMDDGILTAAEIARMNLQTTSLVVMSACQSGLGEVTGEGVFGLQRAFKKAGVRSLLTSLWEVDDLATQLMMTSFYQALTQGQNKQQALMTAQAAVRAQHFKRADGSMQSGTDPYYWAAFVLMDAD